MRHRCKVCFAYDRLKLFLLPSAVSKSVESIKMVTNAVRSFGLLFGLKIGSRTQSLSTSVTASFFTSTSGLSRMAPANPIRPLVICGPSGVGKSTIVNNLLNEFPNVFGFSVSHTTRKPREGEQVDWLSCNRGHCILIVLVMGKETLCLHYALGSTICLSPLNNSCHLLCLTISLQDNNHT